ncbi:DUF5331 domain-containing protein [Calothrix sp. PCC 6303]|uniref:DUF5331 domain-containing protein n=1 Tax=Calothrix sp. PCC 6303 TaxID=1170562 RepID=UPI0002A0305C|nr:DUF5331 domain-containing protein [Calothrix sp. PCC 6303]AFZ02451.1 hypothetical protein Cal6303_3519 [Calothrix sp. PCC 6303]
MAFFYSFTESLKQKWLDFFQANRDWIKLHMQVESVYTPDGGKRPPSYLILGVANALEPKLAQLMLPFSKLNPDADTLVEVLGLNFDPDIALGNHGTHEVESGLGESDPNQMMVDEEISLDGIDEINDDEFGDISGFSQENHKIESHPMSVATSSHEFADISLDTPKQGRIDYQEMEEISGIDEESGFGNVLVDVWGEENSASRGKDDGEMLLGEEFGSGAFDDSEIARLFPNA